VACENSAVALVFRPLMTWVVPLEIAFALATIAIIPQTVAWVTTYSGASATAALADLGAGIGLMAAGTAFALTNLRAAVGRTAILAGIAWLAADWIGWQGGIALARTLAMAGALFYLPLVLHLVTLYQRMPVPSIMRRVVLVGYASTALLALGLLLFRDPGVDLTCWNNCTDDVLLIGNQPVIASAVRLAIPAVEIGLAGAIIGIATLTLAHGTAAERRMTWVVVVPTLIIGAASAAHGVALLVDPHEGPLVDLHNALFQGRAWAAVLLALGLGWTIVRTWRSRSAVTRLAAELGDAPESGTVGPALAAATKDATLEVLYWLPHLGHFVDAAGTAAHLPRPDDGRPVTRISHAGRLICAVIHDPAVIDSTGLDRMLGAAARLTLENERLRAELLAKLEDVRLSRARIVAAGDAARASLERDLHDGAQQGLMAVLYELRRAADAAAASSNGDARDRLVAALREAEALLGDLRDLAHGIYPAVLRDKGLQAAARSLRDTASIPVEVNDMPTERLPEAVERAGYAVLESGVDGAISSGAAVVSVRGSSTDRGLSLQIEGAGPGPFQDIADRVGAADGRMWVDGQRLLVWIPCG
jgi:signal transduction histidine kinase